MNNLNEIKSKFISIYKPLIADFLSNIKDHNLQGVPEPCLPSFGKNYALVKYKIAFVGRDAKGYGDLNAFNEDFRNNPDAALFRNEIEFDEFDFLNYTNNFGKSFWDYIIQFLATFYKIENWKNLKKAEFPEILSSFIWANTNSISPQTEIPNGDKLVTENYSFIKQQSSKIDNIHNIINSLNPDIIIVLNWNLTEEYFHNSSGESINFQNIDDHLLYSRISNKHVYWHAHPTWINRNIGYEDSLNHLIENIRSKVSLTDSTKLEYPSNSSKDERKENIVKLAEYLFSRNHKMSGYELVLYCNRNNIKSLYGYDYVYGRGIYAFIRSVYNYCLYTLKNPETAHKVAVSFVNENGYLAYE